jgi:hypothetical protein
VRESVPSNIGLIVLFIGTIDSYDPNVSPTLSIPISEFRANVRHILRKCIEHGISTNRLLVVTGPPSPSFRETIRPQINAILYSNASIEVANELGIKYLDLRARMTKDFVTSKGWDPYFDTSGLFNYKGAVYFYNFLFPHVQIKLKEFLGTDYLTRKFPGWSPSPSG